MSGCGACPKAKELLEDYAKDTGEVIEVIEVSGARDSVVKEFGLHGVPALIDHNGRLYSGVKQIKEFVKGV
jgi:thiol-disulfide isomerase/thioredoxin